MFPCLNEVVTFNSVMRGFAIRVHVKEARVLIMEHRTRVTVEMGTRVQVILATFVLKVTSK